MECFKFVLSLIFNTFKLLHNYNNKKKNTLEYIRHKSLIPEWAKLTLASGSFQLT